MADLGRAWRWKVAAWALGAEISVMDGTEAWGKRGGTWHAI